MGDEHDISAIKKKLLGLAKRGKPVFLYGRDSIGRRSMIGKIVKDLFETNRYLNCRKEDGEDIYNKITNKKVRGTLFRNNVSLFVDTMYCDPNNNEDAKYYNKLAKIIKNGSIEMEEDEYPSHYPDDVGVLYDYVTVKWLVVYSREPDNFPPYFKRQFRMFSLGDDTEKESVRFEWDIAGTRDVSCNGEYIAKLSPLQFNLFECLYKKPGEDVKTKDLEKCWDERPEYEGFLSDAISKLNEKLMVGLQKRHIEIGKYAIGSELEIKRVISYKLVT